MKSSVNMYASTWICAKTKEVKRPSTERAISSLSLDEGKRSSVDHLEL